MKLKRLKKKSIVHEDWNSYDDPLSDQNFLWKFPPNPSKIPIKRQDSHRICSNIIKYFFIDCTILIILTSLKLFSKIPRQYKNKEKYE